MKAHKLSLILALVVLSVMLLAAPVQAGRTVTTFVDVPVRFTNSEVVNYRWSGTVSHADYITWLTVESDDPRLAGELTWVCHEITVTQNPQYALWDWGNAPGTWRLVTSTEGGVSSGWEGTVSHPPNKEGPEGENLYARGNGFGMYKNMHIEWEIIDGMRLFSPPNFAAGMSGQYSETVVQ